MNLLLIGYRGTGKTTVARELARRIGCEWIDADVEVELAAGKSISAIFQDEGESVFRDWETRVLRNMVEQGSRVLALGGGVVLRDENRQLLRTAGTTIWLTASPTVLAARINTDETTAGRRPNLTAGGGITEIEQLLALREPLYRECADFTVDTESNTPSQIAEAILQHLDPSSQ